MCGQQLSPFSATTILSATTAECSLGPIFAHRARMYSWWPGWALGCGFIPLALGVSPLFSAAARVLAMFVFLQWRGLPSELPPVPRTADDDEEPRELEDEPVQEDAATQPSRRPRTARTRLDPLRTPPRSGCCCVPQRMLLAAADSASSACVPEVNVGYYGRLQSCEKSLMVQSSRLIEVERAVPR